MKDKQENKLMLLCNLQSTLLSTSAKQKTEQIIEEYGSDYLESMSDDKMIGNEYDIRSYSLFEDERSNMILISSGCNLEDYENEKDLPDTLDLADKIDKGKELENIYHFLNSSNKSIVFIYEWFNSPLHYVKIEDTELYEKIYNGNYLESIGIIEEYVDECANRSGKMYECAQIIDTVYMSDNTDFS